MSIEDLTNGDIEEKKEFTSQDRENYLKRLTPYEDKVFKRKEFLDEEDFKALEGIKEELRTIYGLKSSIIYGKIGGIISFNRLRLNSKKEEELEKEYRNLAGELKKEKLSPDEEKNIYERLDEICFILEPEHYRPKKTN